MTASPAPEIMTLREVAEYLRLAERTVLRMAKRGELPAAKIASQWRFLRSVIRDWVAGQMQCLAPVDNIEAPLYSLDEILPRSLMRFSIEAAPKEGVLRQLVAPLEASGRLQDSRRFLTGCLEREAHLALGPG